MSLKSSSVAITLKNVQKTFDDGTLALKPLDLDIDAGEILVLLGLRVAARQPRCD